MSALLAAKQLLVGSPLEGPAQYLRSIIGMRRRWLSPELSEILLEEQFLDRILKKLLKPDSNIIDVGAHIGSFTSRALRMAPNGHQILIEAVPNKSKALRLKFPNATVHQLAVSDRIGTVMFEQNISKPGHSRIGTESARGDKTIQYEVATSTIDILSPGRVDLIKIDVEGHEANVLRGSLATVKRNRPAILFECGAEIDLIKDGVSRRELFDVITETLGYKIYTFAEFFYSKGPVCFEEFLKCGQYPFRAFNFLALP